VGNYRTPLRYPGGKQKLAPFFLELIQVNDLVGGHYVEPFAGGAGVAMELLFQGVVNRVHLNDSCSAVYAFWHSILNESEEFCRRVSRASLTIDEWYRQKEIINRPTEVGRIELGFATFYLNRCNRSGILKRAGVIGGISQQGTWKMDARFSRKELIQRIEAISNRRKDIKIRNWDAEKFLVNYCSKLPDETLIYCDPPYYNKAARLYMNHYSPEDHANISEVIQSKIRHKWVVSYDNAPQIFGHYKKRRSFVYQIQYNAAKVYKGEEIIIVSDDLVLPEKASNHSINAALQMCK
jgi:DNA adenine methylase